MEMTQPVSWIGQDCLGYAMSAEFTGENKLVLGKLIKDLLDAFPGLFFAAPIDGLHITLLDWVAPLVEYDGKNKEELFRQVKDEYDRSIATILADIDPFPINFSEVRITPNAIIIVGKDDGQFQSIREKFIQQVELIPGTKPPPQLIHCTLVRFIKVVDMAPIASYVDKTQINFDQLISQFRLTRSVKEPMLDFSIVHSYMLGISAG